MTNRTPVRSGYRMASSESFQPWFFKPFGDRRVYSRNPSVGYPVIVIDERARVTGRRPSVDQQAMLRQDARVEFEQTEPSALGYRTVGSSQPHRIAVEDNVPGAMRVDLPAIHGLTVADDLGAVRERRRPRVGHGSSAVDLLKKSWRRAAPSVKLCLGLSA